MARFAACLELDCCLTQARDFWIPELREEEARFRNCRFSQPVPGDVLQAFLARRVLVDIGGQFIATLRLGSDTDWRVRAIEKGGVRGLLPEVLVFRRLHRIALTRRQASAGQDAALYAFKASRGRRQRHRVALPYGNSSPMD